MDACKNPHYQKIVVKSCSQVGKTELLLNIIGYYAHTDPSPILLVQPTVELAEAFSKDRLAPMLRDTPILHGLISEAKSRASNNTIRQKMFPGGHISLIGANSPSNLAMRPIRILLCDEINRYPASAGTEGNPVKLAERRTTTFHNKVIILVSTPTDKGSCAITHNYDLSSKGRYSLLCPSCDEPHYITRKSLIIEDDPIKVRAVCPSCAAIHSETEWKSREGVYVHEHPDNPVRGFLINGYASLFNTWDNIEREFREASKNIEDLKVFINTVLAEEWEEPGERADPEALLERRENYEQPPMDCLVMTCAVDVQDNRLEYEVCGWGKGLESWSIEYGVFNGDPARKEVWQQVKDLFDKKRWQHDSGHEMKITAMTIDLGGHHTQQVYEFCQKMKPERVWPIRGVGGWGLPLVKQGTSRIKRTGVKVNLWNIAVDQAKIWIERRLKQTEPGDGYCHFNFKFNNELYFQGLTSEKLLNTRDKKGYPVKKWVLEAGKRNEPLDLRVYNYAAVKMLNPIFEKLKLNYSKEPLSAPVKKKKRRTGVLSKGID